MKGVVLLGTIELPAVPAIGAVLEGCTHGGESLAFGAGIGAPCEACWKGGGTLAGEKAMPVWMGLSSIDIPIKP